MRPFPIVPLAALLLTARVHGQGLPSAPQPANLTLQADDAAWDRLTLLTPESQISVRTARGTYRCQEPRVTETQFYCEVPSPRGLLGAFLGPRSIQLGRMEVVEVGLRHPYRTRLIGYGTAAAAGIAFGAVGANPPSGEPHAVSAAAGGAIFCLAAFPIVEAIATFSHGTTLYRRLSHPASQRPD